MMLTQEQITSFQKFILDFYAREGRPFAWRDVNDPYKVLVSEIMLQQTQTYRVAPKYEQFIAELPTFASLADAPLRDVLFLWQGLGYNRRGVALQKCAQKVMQEFNGVLPHDPEVLVTFPGLGKATAASVATFAYNEPTVFIETNVRAVFIHTFFKDKNDVHDKELMPLIAQTLDAKNSRRWYYALMDYGVMLKKKFGNPSRKSKHHVKQSKFEGSDRQIRGRVIKALTLHESLGEKELLAVASNDHARARKIIDQLCAENMIQLRDSHTFSIKE